MNRDEERIYAARRLENKRREVQLKEQRAKRNPERMKRIMPVQFMRRILRGA